MSVIRLAGFAGANRALHPKMLPEAVGVVSVNQKPGRGDLRPWRAPLPVASVPTGRKTIYRMGRDVASDTQYWLSWPGVVHAARGFDADDTTERTYFTGDGEPKVTSNTMGLASAPYPTASRTLGLPAPATPLSASVNTGAFEGLDNSYFYAYTYVNDWGWESAPSPPSAEVVRKTDATVTLSGFATPPAGSYFINRVRVYRTQTSGTVTEFFFLREIAIGQSTTDDNRDLGEVMPTTSWLMPPADLSFLTTLWNGMLAGISGNAVRFCEPYTPYAWPIAYDVVPPDAKPVALGVAGQSLLVLTSGRPLVVAGSSPEAMDQTPLEFSQGCVSAKSVAGMGAGVAWASGDGLCWWGPSTGPKLLTAGLMTRDDWQAIKPSTVIGQMYEGLYFGSYDDGAGRKGFLIDPANPTGIYFTELGYEAMHFDELQDQLYVLDGVNVKRWDAGTPMATTFKSKVFRSPRPTCFGVAEVIADAYPVTFKLYADGVLKHTQSVASRNPFRLPGGFMALDWQIEVAGSNPVQAVAVANAMAELMEA